MGTTRRQRNKAEGTFLESVKVQLDQLLREVANIQTFITELRSNQNRFVGPPGLDCDPWQPPFPSWSAWENWEQAYWNTAVHTSDDLLVERFQVGELGSHKLSSPLPPWSAADYWELTASTLKMDIGQDCLDTAHGSLSKDGQSADPAANPSMPAVATSNLSREDDSDDLGKIVLLNWRPSSAKVFAKEGSNDYKELQEEAVCVLQQWFRFGDLADEMGETYEESRDCNSVDSNGSKANSPAKLAVRRAFMASIHSGSRSTTIVADDETDYWTMDEVTLWVRKALDQASQAHDAAGGA